MDEARRAMELSVVVPVFNCAGCIGPLLKRLTAAVEGLVPSYELVFVDDRSEDGSWEALLELAPLYPELRLVRLSRNFGQEAAIVAGLERARSAWTVVMDCDLQDPPELVPLLYARAQEGFDVVRARRTGNDYGVFRRAGTGAYRWILRHLLGTRVDLAVGNFSIVSRRARQAVCDLGDVSRDFSFILSWIGFAQSTVDFDRPARADGKSAYTFRRLVRYALDSIVFQSSSLLRWIINVGLLVAAFAVALAVYFAIHYFIAGTIEGFTSLAVLILALGGFIIVSVGTTGLYIERIFEQVKNRPLFVVDVDSCRDTEHRDRVES